MDPHKWLFQPYECGCVLVREGSQLRSAFQISPDYLKDAAGELVEVNFADHGLQLVNPPERRLHQLARRKLPRPNQRRKLRRRSEQELSHGPKAYPANL